MFIKKIAVLLFLLTILPLGAKDNLLVNGSFMPGATNYPAAWRFYSVRTTGYLETFKNGGPGNRNFLRFTGKFRINQKTITLVSSGKYKLCAWVRTRNQVAGKSGVFLTGYVKPLLVFPENQHQWTYVERIWKFNNGVPGNQAKINIAVNAEGFELDIADLKLLPVSDNAKVGAGNMYQTSRPALIPCFKTRYIPLSKPEAEFSWEGKFPGDLNNAVCKAKLEKSDKNFQVKFNGRKVKFHFPGINAVQDNLLLTVCDRSGKIILQEKFAVEFRDIPTLPAASRKLNNFTTELPAVNLNVSGESVVVNPREGWLYFSFKGDKEFLLTLDGKNFLDSNSLRKEAFIRLEPGKYTIKAVKGNGKLTVRLIAETILFPIQHCAIAYEKITPEFLNLHHFSSLTTINCGGDPAQIRAAGRSYMTNYPIVDLRKTKTTVAEMLNRMNKADHIFAEANFDGTTLDELDYAFGIHAFENFATLMRKFPNPHNKLLYTYTTGPVNASLREFFSAAANASKSRGKILHECYERMKPTKKDMEHHLDQMTANVANYKNEMPDLFENVAMIFDLSSEVPLRSLAHYPEQDFKYHLDMLLHRAATDPALDGLGGIGFWGAHRASGETQRWALRLLRHYVIEGKSTMLSDEYGFSYHPGHVKNPDFAEKLNFWQANAQVCADYFPGYGSSMQMRSQAFAGLGDTFALFRRTADAYGEVRQKLTGLIPGKSYTLVYLTCDREAMAKNQYIPRELKLNYTLTGTKIREDIIFADPRFAKGKRVMSGKKPCINQRFVVFIPEKSEVELVFDNKSAAPGEKTALNYVAVRPYYD